MIRRPMMNEKPITCAPLSVHATMAECRALAKEYGKFDTRALNVTGLPAVVSYHCVAAEPGAIR